MQSSYQKRFDQHLRTTQQADTLQWTKPWGFFLTQELDYLPGLNPFNKLTVFTISANRCPNTITSCASAPPNDNIVSTLTAVGKTDLLQDMQYSWKSTDSNDERLGRNMFNNYETCLSTITPSWYTKDMPDDEPAIDYFQATASLHKTVQAYAYLRDACIVLSTTAQSTNAEIL